MLESTIKFHSIPVNYIPALDIGSLTVFFDSFQKWGAKEETIKPKLISQAMIEKNFKVLDLGCGTGTLALLVKKSQPSADVTGIDIDPHILSIAKKKAAQANIPIKLDLGTAFNLPYPDNSFDRVLSSLVFHHLTRENKLGALKEVLRVLKENGELHIADMGKPQNLLMRFPSVVMRRLEETSKLMAIFGTIALYKGLKTSSQFFGVNIWQKKVLIKEIRSNGKNLRFNGDPNGVSFFCPLEKQSHRQSIYSSQYFRSWNRYRQKSTLL